jgi:ribosomal protein L3 glutamine methyltransferase
MMGAAAEPRMPLEPFDVVAQHLTSVTDFVRWGASRLHEAGAHFGHGTDNAIDESAALVLFAVGLPHDAPARLFDGRLTPAEKRRAWELIERRIRERKPAAYLTGEAWFAGLRFKVNEQVLVPRSPLAESVEARFAPWVDAGAVERVLDLCTGSGCIAIASALALPGATVDASDVSEAALALAAENVALHRVGDRVRLVRSDVFEALAGERYDLVVSNPPYVDAADMAALPDEFRHEPALGLAAGADGLDVVMRILRDAAEHLTTDGVLICETGNSAAALEARCAGVAFTWIEFERGEGEVFVLSRDELQRHAAAFA